MLRGGLTAEEAGKIAGGNYMHLPRLGWLTLPSPTRNDLDIWAGPGSQQL